MKKNWAGPRDKARGKLEPTRAERMETKRLRLRLTPLKPIKPKPIEEKEEPIELVRYYKTPERRRAWHRVRARLRKKLVKPAACQKCQLVTCRLHMHHAGESWSELYNQGVHEDLSRHIIVWLCPRCHAKAHEGEPVSRIINHPDSRTS